MRVRTSAVCRLALMAMACFVTSSAVAVTASPNAPRENPIAAEPFYAGIVAQARALQLETEAFVSDPALMSGARFTTYDGNVRALAEANMQAHLDLKARGTDNDLKCILKGISLDMTVKMDAIGAARTDEARLTALDDMVYLLGDNIDVIVTPATADSGMDCVIEFGAG